jgi:hypothetical protein
MYPLTELAALASHFDQLTLRRVGGLTLARQCGSVAELATLDLASASDTIAWMSPRWHVKPQPLVDDFLLGYRRAGGPGRLYPAMQAVRALTNAFRLAGSPSGSTGTEQT